jgi:hypothetical protein
MAQAATVEDLKTDAVLPVEPRRFCIPDLDTHGGWLVPRLVEQYPAMNTRSAANFIRSIVYANDYMFLFLPGAAALAQMTRDYMLDPTPVVRERFVWCRDKSDAVARQQASAFYDEFTKWARHMGCEIMFVEEASDVPHEAIRERVGRVYMRQQQFVRL